MSANFQQLSNFIWSVADLLRGPYRPPQYERVMLPLTVLRRFDAVLAPTKAAVLERHAALATKGIANLDAILNNLAKDEAGRALGFHNHSQLDFHRLKGDPDQIGRHLADYIAGFSENIRKIFERFDFEKEIEKLEESNRLYQVVAQFAEIDLHPAKVDNITMGLVFEDLIRRFNEAANETAGDHFTPREVIQFMVNLLLEPDTEVLTQAGIIVTICDPARGTGGMLAEAQSWIRAHNEQAIVKVFGQDYNPRSYAVAASDLLIKGHRDSRVEFGNTLIDARDRWTPMKRSLGDKRRTLKQDAIDALTTEHGACARQVRQWVLLDKDGKPLRLSPDRPTAEPAQGQRWVERLTSQVFDNADFGYRRISVLRPLRLRFQITPKTKGRFLATCPELRDAVQSIEETLGTEPSLDWNAAWTQVQKTVKTDQPSRYPWARPRRADEIFRLGLVR